MALHESLALDDVPVDPAAADVATPRLSLTIGHVLAGVGADHDPPIRLNDILVIRHALRPGGHRGLQGPDDLTEELVTAYTREQSPDRFRAAPPPRFWVILVADGARRSRLWGTFENHGEVVSERTEAYCYFDLRPSSFLAPLNDRLVVEWDNPRVWLRRADSSRTAAMPVLEIADRDTVPFPGFDNVRLTYPKLCDIVEDHRYAGWQAALSEVQGVYLITDSSNGKQYVGKADGAERILGRWRDYARNGHGGNVALRELADASRAAGSRSGTTIDHARHFVFSILRVFGPSTSSTEVDAAESHYKRALMTREFGLNRN